MDTTNLTALPDSFPAGISISYLKSLTGYSNATWTLHLYLAGPNALEVTGVAEGSGWRITLDAAATEELGAGTYQWIERLEKTTPLTRFELASGTVQVKPAIAGAGDGDLQSWAERTLGEVETAIKVRLAGGVLDSYSVSGRAAQRVPLETLYKMRAELTTIVAQAKTGARPSKQILVTFNQP